MCDGGASSAPTRGALRRRRLPHANDHEVFGAEAYLALSGHEIYVRASSCRQLQEADVLGHHALELVSRLREADRL